MFEQIRFVIWDLDECFWRGTLTEGGIKEYVQENHDIVIELAKRGIISSICSKNDFSTVEAILREKGIFDYFVFPSIEWTAKGFRIKQIIEKVQLRAPTVLYIDDNSNNRAEALALIPDLQVADETSIPGLLGNPLLKGKDDEGLTRLAQYKLLEMRKADEAASGGE